jgi:hypothetical protein
MGKANDPEIISISISTPEHFQAHVNTTKLALTKEE